MHSLCTFKIYNRNYIKAREKKELNNKKKTRFTLLIKAVKQKKSIREKHKKKKTKTKIQHIMINRAVGTFKNCQRIINVKLLTLINITKKKKNIKSETTKQTAQYYGFVKFLQFKLNN